MTILPFFKNALNQDSELKVAFEKLTPGKQREYAEHIGLRIGRQQILTIGKVYTHNLQAKAFMISIKIVSQSTAKS